MSNPKKGNKLDRGNYHPISLLNIPSKVFESIICDQLDSHITKNGLSNKHRWGFTTGKSTELLMPHLTETWKNALDQEKIIGVLYIDFKKAFDSVCHQILASITSLWH